MEPQEVRLFGDTGSIRDAQFLTSSFSDLPLDTEKEVCRGIAYMNSYLGVSNENVQIFCEPLQKFCAQIDYENGYAKITIDSRIKEDDAFISAIHEYMHLYDSRNGEIASRLVEKAFNELGVSFEEQVYIRGSILPYDSDDYDKLFLDDELLAYSAERIVTDRFTTETDAFLRSIKKEIER